MDGFRLRLCFKFFTGTNTRHPNNHIYLENGNPIYSIIEELRTASLSALDDVLKVVAGSFLNEEYFQDWKEFMLAAFHRSPHSIALLKKPVVNRFGEAYDNRKGQFKMQRDLQLQY